MVGDIVILHMDLTLLGIQWQYGQLVTSGLLYQRDQGDQLKFAIKPAILPRYDCNFGPSSRVIPCC